MRERRTDGGKLMNQEVHRISKKDVRAAIKRIKNAKVVGLDGIPVEVRQRSRLGNQIV